MSCTAPQSKPDWNAYALGEADAAARAAAEAHAAVCAACREELAALRVTLNALSTLRDEEIPRRIAFVSDKVFEPKWWQQLWNPTFASACVIAAAILVHAFVGVSSNEAAVAKAVAQVEARHAEQVAEFAAYTELMDKQMKQIYISSNGIVRQ